MGMFILAEKTRADLSSAHGGVNEEAGGLLGRGQLLFTYQVSIKT